MAEITRINESDLTKMALPVEFNTDRIADKLLDLPYGNLEEQKLDIYFPNPRPEGLMPVLFYVHGGGWTMGTKRMGALDCIIDALDKGYALVVPDYRLAPGVCFPEFLYDVKTAVRWARAHAAVFGFDPNRFGMIGDSAGGHITLMMAMTADMPQYEGADYGWENQSSALQAACDMYGPAVLDADEAAWYLSSGAHRMLMEGETDEPGLGKVLYDSVFGTRNLSLLRMLSPVTHVNKGMAPLLIQHGEEDSIVPVQHSYVLAEKIRRVCGPKRCRLVTYPDRNHSDKRFMTKENCDEVLAFFDQYLKKAAE